MREVEVETTRDGQGCRELSVNFGYKNVVLMVAKELRPNRCLFEHVYEHEQRHVALYREFMTRELPARLGRLQDLLQSSTAELPDDAVKPVLQNALQGVLREVVPRHHEIDSDEEYSRNGRVCNRALRRLSATF